MSWERRGPESDLYVFEDHGYGLICCDCPFYPHANYALAAFGADVAALRDHVFDHAAAGHKVGDLLNACAEELGAAAEGDNRVSAL